MWKRMSEEEARRERNKARWNMKDPGAYAIMIFFFSAVCIKIGPDKWKADFFPISWEEFFTKGLLNAFLIGLATFLVFYVPQIILKRNFASGPPAVMCLKCGKVKNGKKASPCACGGSSSHLTSWSGLPMGEFKKKMGLNALETKSGETDYKGVNLPALRRFNPTRYSRYR